MILGAAWFSLASNLIIPFYGGSSASLARHANKFGLSKDSIFDFNSIPENISTLSAQLLTTSNLEYLALLIAPAFFIFLAKKPKHTAIRLIPFFPLLIINLLSTSLSMKSLVFQYSAFLVPLLSIETTYFLQENGSRLNFISKESAQRIVIITSLVGFVALSRITFFLNQYHTNFPTINELNVAISLVNEESSVLTSSVIAPHLSKRRDIRVSDRNNSLDISQYDEILLDTARPGWKSNSDIVDSIRSKARESDKWEVAYHKKSIFLWRKLNNQQ